MEIMLKSLGIDNLENELTGRGIPRFRASQILEWTYSKGVSDYSDMTNLPKSMREQLAESYPISTPTIVERQVSYDGTRKYLIEYHDGAKTEMVGLPSSGRLTVCVSSQSGCAMGCAFCATGQNGLTRSLLPGELIDQILIVSDDFSERVTNVVIMGQGEPFSNFDNVVKALRIMNHPKLLNIGARHITVSTSGIIKGIDRFSYLDEQFTLAVSLHSARQQIRNRIMPKHENQDLQTLKSALVRYTEKTNRRFSFEYALMKGVNDSSEDLDALVNYCDGLLCHVNLIPLNRIAESRFQPVSDELMVEWRDALEAAHVPVSIRQSRGSDIDAACGQLASKAM